jgi:hypothetical protein
MYLVCGDKMSIAEVVEHLYIIDKRRDRVEISFLTNRVGWFIPVFLIFGLCFTLLWVAFHFRWNENLIAALVGGSISISAGICFAVAEHITRYKIIIEPEVVSFQREFQGIPVGGRRVYARSLITDLGMYPGMNRVSNRPPFQWGRLCVWADRKSVEIESFFPVAEGASLTGDLRMLGIEFRRTFPKYEQEHLLFAGSLDYFSF